MSIQVIAVLLPVICLPNVSRGAEGDPKPQFTISGVVTEPGLTRGLADVEVQLECFDASSFSSVSPKNMVGKVVTGSNGSFHFTVGESARCRVTVQKTGYTSSSASDVVVPSTATVLVDKANPVRTLKLELARPVQLSGVIVDRDAREPVAGLVVRAHGYSYRSGHVALSMRGISATDERGHFQFKDLPPGRYVISSGPRLYTAAVLGQSELLRKAGHARFLTPFTNSDATKIDEDYDTTYWPGDGGLDSAFPIAVASGSDLDLGTLAIKSVTMYRARVDIPEGECAAGGVIDLHLRRISNPWLGTTLGKVPCGGGGVIRGLIADSYRLEAMGAGAKGVIEFTVAHENVSISVPLQRGVSLDGVVSLRGPTPIDLSGVRLILKPRTWAVQHPPIVVAADGHFRVDGVAPRDYVLMVTGIPPSHCLREMRYNGRQAQGTLFSVDPFALDHKLELVVEDQAASVSGAVTVGNDRAFRPWIALSAWPPADDLYDRTTVMAADDDGQFRITGLVPGQYRLVAVPFDSIEELHRPGVLGALLRGAERLELTGKETRAVQVKLTTPRQF